MEAALRRLSDRALIGVYRVAKTRLRVWFADPHAMMKLRAEIERRGLEAKK